MNRTSLTDRIADRIFIEATKAVLEDAGDELDKRVPALLSLYAKRLAEAVEAELQLTEEKRVKYREPAHDAHLGNVSCDCGDTITTASPYVTAEPDGSLWHGNKQGGGHKSNFDRKKERRWVSAWSEVKS